MIVRSGIRGTSVDVSFTLEGVIHDLTQDVPFGGCVQVTCDVKHWQESGPTREHNELQTIWKAAVRKENQIRLCGILVIDFRAG